MFFFRIPSLSVRVPTWLVISIIAARNATRGLARHVEQIGLTRSEAQGVQDAMRLMLIAKECQDQAEITLRDAGLGHAARAIVLEEIKKVQNFSSAAGVAVI